MPHVMQRDRAELVDWAGRTGVRIDADPSYVHESTWADFLHDRIESANALPETVASDPPSA